MYISTYISSATFAWSSKLMVDIDSMGPGLQLLGGQFSNFLLGKVSLEFKLHGMSIFRDIQMATYFGTGWCYSHMVGYAAGLSGSILYLSSMACCGWMIICNYSLDDWVSVTVLDAILIILIIIIYSIKVSLLILLSCIGVLPVLCTNMWPIVTDNVAWSVCHDHEPCKNHWTDRDAIWVVTPVGSRNRALDGSPDLPMGRRQFWGKGAAHCRV